MKGRKSTLIKSKSELMKILAEYAVDGLCCTLCSGICFFGLANSREYLPFQTIFAWVCHASAWLMNLFTVVSGVSALFLINLSINEGDKVCIWYRWKVVRFFLMLHWRVFSRLDESMKRYEEAREEEEEEDSAV